MNLAGLSASDFVGMMLARNIEAILGDDSPVVAGVIVIVFNDDAEKLTGGAAIGGTPKELRMIAMKMRQIADEIDAGKHDSVKVNAEGGSA